MKNISIIILAAVIVYLLLQPNQPIQLPPIKQFETRIKNNYDTITKYETKIVNKWFSNDQLESELNDLYDSLEVYKQKKDTVRIIVTQSNSIVKLQQSNDTLKTIIVYKDTIISKQKNIIADKDTIILIKDNKLKKVKRQRNISIAVVTALVAREVVSVFKK